MQREPSALPEDSPAGGRKHQLLANSLSLSPGLNHRLGGMPSLGLFPSPSLQEGSQGLSGKGAAESGVREGVWLPCTALVPGASPVAEAHGPALLRVPHSQFLLSEVQCSWVLQPLASSPPQSGGSVSLRRFPRRCQAGVCRAVRTRDSSLPSLTEGDQGGRGHPLGDIFPAPHQGCSDYTRKRRHGSAAVAWGGRRTLSVSSIARRPWEAL